MPVPRLLLKARFWSRSIAGEKGNFGEGVGDETVATATGGLVLAAPFALVP